MTNPIKIVNKSEFDKENKKPSQETVWDSIADSWKVYVAKKIPVVEEFLKGKVGKIADLGCGTGRNMIKQDGVEYYGVDFSNVQLEHAKRLIDEEGINAKLFKSRLDKLPKEFEDGMFDYGLFIATLHCLESKKQRMMALKEFYRILKPGAEALISVWSSEDKRFSGKDKDIYMSWSEDRVLYMRYYHLYGKQEFIELIKSVGFEILEFYEPREHPEKSFKDNFSGFPEGLKLQASGNDRFSKKNWIARIKKQG
jgi:ubiquinone/menaquinone biosynthesis C-methylase UbiE